MSLRKVGKFYWLDIRIDGKRIRRSLKVTSYFEALDKFKQVKDKLLEERQGKDVRFADFAKQYLDWAWTSKPASADREEQRLKKIQAFFADLNILFLSEITPYHIEQLKAYLLEKGRIIKTRKGPKETGLSKPTVNRYLQLLRGMIYRAIDWEIYSKPNPLKKVRFFREEPKMKLLSQGEIVRILEAAEEIRARARSPLQRAFRDIIRMALNTGMRKSEILNLRWTDIQGDELIVKGKREKTRAIPLNVEARKAIERQPRRDLYVFWLPNRNQLGNFRRTVNLIRKRTGIDFHFHLLRHRFSTSLLEKGVDIVTVSELLGHSKAMTSLIYSHTDKERKWKAVNSLIN